jgi:bifunctional non-homologous end joining protein LigD
MEVQHDLRARLGKLAAKTAPAPVPRAEARGAHWVKPDLVAEIAFAEFTADNVVRHASFLGLRGDKKAKEVVAEMPQALPEPALDDVKISNPDRVIFPDAKVTKGELADYYRAMGAPMAVWTANRPISLVRCPQGRAKKCFFQKHDSGTFGAHVLHVPIREKDGHKEDYLYVEDSAGVIACVQMGTIEFHGWGSKVVDVEKPDRIVFDLDPDVGLDFGLVKNFQVHEGKRVQFRAEAFNLLNRVNFGNPASNLNATATLGRITTAGDSRVIQLALRFVF